MPERQLQDDVVIEATPFAPSTATSRRRRLPITPGRALAIILALAAAYALWFIFTARSVRFEMDPAAASIVIDEFPAIEVGDTYLLWEGTYRATITAPGYHGLVQSLAISDDRNQTIAITLDKLPGTVRFEIDPPGARVRVGSAEGIAPFELELTAGAQTALIDHPRYQGRSIDFDVVGMGEHQVVARALAPNWAQVTIPTEPANATVMVDDEEMVEKTPGPIPILAGQHRIVVDKPGYQSWVDIIEVVAQRDVTLPPITLVKVEGRLRLTSTPSDAGVTVDGNYQGTTPITVDVQPDTRLSVRLFKIGYGDETRHVRVDSGSEASLAVELEAQTGEVSIEMLPADAQLIIDGESRGTGGRVEVLSTTQHEIVIQKEGYASYRKLIVPQPTFRQELKVRLLTLEEARIAALPAVRTTSEGHELVLLKPDKVQLGASRREPGRRVNEVLREATLTRLFYLGRHEVTNAQFRRFEPEHTSGEFTSLDLDKDDQPVTGVSWQEAALYCNWLSAQDDLPPFYREEQDRVIGFDASSTGYRLPTEAEWSWAVASLSGGTRFAWGTQLPPPDRFENYADRSAQNALGRIIFGYNDNHIVAAPVGIFAANAHGIHDLSGNVAEWMHDIYEIPEAGAVTDPMGAAEGEYHVIKGASWKYGTVTDLRTSYRDYGSEERQDVGFRIARFAE